MSQGDKQNIGGEALSVRVYAAGRRSGFLNTLKAILRDFGMAHSLGYRFASRNIRARYRQSLLGIFWALLPPLATAGVWVFLNQANIISVQAGSINYPLFVITGTMLWSVFSSAVSTPIQIIQANTSILVKINFPREALVINAFYEIAFNTTIAMLIIIGELLFFHIPLTWQMLVFLPAIFILILMGICLGLMIMPLAMLYRDIQFMLPLALQFGMYLTPVVYAVPVLSGYGRILSLNPVTPVLNLAREAVTGSAFTVGFADFSIISLVVILIFFAGLFFQRLAMEILIERMGS